ERIETAHQQQTAALDLQLKQQARSLNELQTACTSALVSCGTLCSELQRSFEALQSGVERSNRATTTAFG
ncbi:mobilization protein, partial [Aeromonas caviae]